MRKLGCPFESPQVLALAANQLPGAQQIAHGSEAAPDMYQAGEGEDQKQGQAEENVHLENQGCMFHVGGCGNALEGDDVLGPGHEREHFHAVGVLRRLDDGGQTQQQGRQQPQQRHPVHRFGVGGDARIADAAPNQQHQTDENQHAQCAAGDHGDDLLGMRFQPERLKKGERCEQAEKVAEEQADDADVKQIGAPAQRAGAQHLARFAAPQILLAVETHQADAQKDGAGDVGVDAEEKVVPVHDVKLLQSEVAQRAA